jgi:nucleotide-binding universal stress UspA family protein
VRLLVLCVAAPPAPAPVEEAPVELEASALETLARAQQVCREEAVVAIFELGYARTWADAIVEQAQRGSVTLICLSLEPRGPRDAALMNPTVREVLRRAPCSVLLNDATTDLVQIPGNGRDR